VIDIIIPTYNRSDYLAQTLNSVLDVSGFENIEVFVFDNGSTDDTWTFLECHPQKDLFKACRSEHNLPLHESWNACKSLSTQSYFMLLHDDDILRSDFVDVFKNLIKKDPDAVLYHSSVQFINEKNEHIGSSNPRGYHRLSGNDYYLQHLSGNGGFICPSVVYNNNLIPNSLRWRRGLMLDVLFFLECTRYGDVVYSSLDFINYRLHEDSLTQSKGKILAKRFEEREGLLNYLYDDLDKRSIQMSRRKIYSYFLLTISIDIYSFFRLRKIDDIGNLCKSIILAVSSYPRLLFERNFYIHLVKAFLYIFLHKKRKFKR
jgi:glycosyltransferase involved in cell wall biosynthesis